MRTVIVMYVALGLLGGVAASTEDEEMAAYYAQVFAETELVVRPAPAEERRLALEPGERVLDFDVSPLGPEVYALVRKATGQMGLRRWSIDGGPSPADWPLPTGLEAKSLVMHPRGQVLFIGGSQGQESMILRLDSTPTGWQAKPIYRSAQKLRRLVIGPRPFTLYTAVYGEGAPPLPQYRLFFGHLNPDNSYGVQTVSEQGEAAYQVIGDRSGYLAPGADREPTPLVQVPHALPASFMPAGNRLLWQDQQGCFHSLEYAGSSWSLNEPSAVPVAHPLCNGSLTATPNGLGLIHWQANTPGVTLYLYEGRETTPQVPHLTFLGTPSSVPDGKGLVGLIATPSGQALVYTPIQVPLADVINAPLFVDNAQAAARLAERGGVFQATEGEQMYSLYETELYREGSYDATTPSRPYLATTDVFWEIFAAAYEGLFVLQEKQRAMPAFWDFIKAANAYYWPAGQSKPPTSLWAKVFATLHTLHTAPQTRSVEVANILEAGVEYSKLFEREVDYRELTPRGHYSLSPALTEYFKAFKYLTQIAPQADAPVAELQALPAALKTQAQTWIDGYLAFIAPPRRPLVWQDSSGFALPPYAQSRPLRDTLQLFPLAWGFDNEVLNSTVFHPDWPAAEQITDSSGQPRWLPSGLEVAAALGSATAMQALQGELAQYPKLHSALASLRSRAQAAKSGNSDLYQRWLAALAVQWADGVNAPQFNADLWQAKRLQTGLASWATLRHATLLVNERAGAEAGEGGFEEIVMRPPRGYVEPDPATFRAIAGLFEATTAVAAQVLNDPALLKGVQTRLAESAAKARQFAEMAEKQLRGEALTPLEYGQILYLARVAEHHFLVYKALANPVGEYAIVTPDPMPKIADVAGDLNNGLLLSGVGRPLMWTQTVPYFGRRQLVKGAVYSYYEFTAQQPLDDQQWLEQLPQAVPPVWFKQLLVN